ncbi:hypothetical protein [Mesorhizobium sp. Pch-S]|uniref:hypothetical protein n=1 Tax=Mesorhizobium sp. Pch-S TaxID=2082387 RepID=UPI00101102D3|nr:hypothetical protein [Mesorhizobium sp. Pch-S]QAZ46126.1 hypothetical protein C1M53_27570 [Mesorhizobium sp. Pch-S]
MSKLFFKVSWQHNIDRYRDLQKLARKAGMSLQVKNVSRTRGIPVFLFFLTEPGKNGQPFHSLEDAASALNAMAGMGKV